MNKAIVTLSEFLLFIACSKSDSSEDSEETLMGNSEHQIDISPGGNAYSLLMSSSEYNEWKNSDQFTNTEKRTALFQDVYKTFSDKFDFIFLVLNEDNIPENINYYGMLIDVSNNMSGIGIQQYYYSSDYGSSGKLKSVMQLTGRSFIQTGPMLHELMHNWGNFALPTENVDEPGTNLTSYPYWGHWGFTGGSSKGQLGGFEQNSLEEIGTNQYSVNAFGAFANGGNSIPFNEFELYLMGMAPISSVKSFDLFGEITSWEVGSKFNFTANSRTTYDQESIVSLLGPRVPDSSDSQKEFNLLVIVLTDEALTDDQWNAVDSSVEWFSFPGPDENYLYNFYEATNGIGKIIIGE